MAKKDKKEKDDKAKAKGGAKTPEAGQEQKQVFKVPLFALCGLVCAIVFLPSTVLLGVGMMPTFAAFIVDRSKKKSKTLTVGSTNLAGCTPFVLELWIQGHTMEASWDIIADPKTIVIIYSLASVGYLIDWAMTGIVASLLYQKGLVRQEQIKKRQHELVKRWGREVAGGAFLPDEEDGEKDE